MSLRGKRYFFICLIFLFGTLEMSAQTDRISLGADEALKERLTGVRIGYFGENGVHPGLRFGTSLILKEKEKSKKYLFKSTRAKKGSKLKIIQYLLDNNLGFYNHPNNHFGLMIGVGATRMRTKTANYRTVGLSLEANYLRRFYNIPTVELDEDGEIYDIGGAGSNSLVMSFAPSFGKIYGVKKGNRAWHLYAKPHFQYIKYDFGFFPNFAFELGVSLDLIK